VADDNTQRPHQAIAMQVPVQRFQPPTAAATLVATIQPRQSLTVGPTEITRRVSASGLIGVCYQQVSAGRHLAGQVVTVRLHPNVLQVFFAGQLIRTVPAPAPRRSSNSAPTNPTSPNNPRPPREGSTITRNQNRKHQPELDTLRNRLGTNTGTIVPATLDHLRRAPPVLDERALRLRDPHRLPLAAVDAVARPRPTVAAGRLQPLLTEVAGAVGPDERSDDEVAALRPTLRIRRPPPRRLVPDPSALRSGWHGVVGPQVTAADACLHDTDERVGRFAQRYLTDHRPGARYPEHLERLTGR
jgi:hypothetical protein